MKVKELIKKLADLDGDKEIFIYMDWDYLQEDNTFFKEVYAAEDFELNKWYFLKTEDNLSFVEELWRYDTVKDIKEDIDIAKKYMKEEWYEDIVDEGECYYIE
jgi:hypothetical protein